MGAADAGVVQAAAVAQGEFAELADGVRVDTEMGYAAVRTVARERQF